MDDDQDVDAQGGWVAVIDMRADRCAACAAELRFGVLFCTSCGSPRHPSRRAHASSAPARRGCRGWAAAAAAVVVATVLFVAFGGDGDVDTSVLAAGPPPATPTPYLPADPREALAVQRDRDAGVAEALIGSWVPQLAAKRKGLVVEGRPYDEGAIIAEHQRIRAERPDSILVWSGAYASFRGRDFWVTLLNRPFPSAGAVNAWCEESGFAPDGCYAKRLARDGGASGNTVVRSAGVRAGGVPVLGDVWASAQIGFGTARPVEVNAGGDGTSVVDDLTWHSWGGPQAMGRGTASWVPPDGATSDGVPRPAVVIASNLGQCHGRLAYRTVGWYFPTEGEVALPKGRGYSDICEGP